MKNGSIFALLLAVLLGVAAAFIRPAQPVQVETAPYQAQSGLDNPAIAADPSIHPARKCTFATLLPYC